MAVRHQFIPLDVGGFDSERAPLRHRIAGIDDQVEEDLLELSGVGFHVAESWRESHDQHDVFADQTA
jgi:hypothetical protein